ncbi:tripartite ATP-independent transporter DctP family solute receptor [Caldalkalibacillus uzonensis]|uniref:Tripartite ATP-independent transporter DctP family solute receptor n=1 Tax=Caldalkalibacillus uzonensis TaxID=353224 RepID=A0ABU0CYF4_9BACI|nr:TRAP transporter substrate-binding protein [Caldalkalibacillus uzonensis]MDQ0341183.1 tripartite ATP-independent transporter DctP family solute receptor [Caldalkalibacillus uzonensis]
MKGKISVVFLVFFALLTLTACGRSEEASGEGVQENNGSNTSLNEETLVLRLGHVTQTSHPYHMAAEYYANLVEEKSEGNIQIEIYPSRQLGGDLDMLEMIQNGSLDAGFISSSVFSGQTPVMDALQLPFLLDSYEVFAEAIKTDTAHKMLDSLEEINLKGLGINESGMRHVGSNIAPVQSPDDMQGLKIRVAESPLMLDIFRTLGAEPTPMPYGEIYSGLQTGVIDAHEANLPAYIDENFHEVTKYVALTAHFPWPNINIMNLDLFNSLSAEHQQILIEAGKETQVWIVEQLRQVDDESLKKLVETDTQVEELENVQLFLEEVKPVYDKYMEKHPLIQEFVKQVELIKADQ